MLLLQPLSFDKRLYRPAISKIIYSFSKNVANEYGHLPLFLSQFIMEISSKGNPETTLLSSKILKEKYN